MVIVNGSHRKNGATVLILSEMQQQLEKMGTVTIFANVNIKM